MTLSKLTDIFSPKTQAVALSALLALGAFSQAAHAEPNVKYIDITKGSPEFAAEAPYSASKCRQAVVVRGGDQTLIKAVWDGAKLYSDERDSAPTFVLIARDRDRDAKTMEVAFYSGGQHFGDLNITHNDQGVSNSSGITEEVRKMLHESEDYRVEAEQNLASKQCTPPPTTVASLSLGHR